jgi:hypothetical protein
MTQFKISGLLGIFVLCIVITNTSFAQSPYPPLYPQTAAPQTMPPPTYVPPPPAYLTPANPALAYPMMPGGTARQTYGNPYLQPRQPQLQAPSPRPQQAPQQPFRTFSGYLGITLDVVPSPVAAQLPKGSSQGVLIKGFAPDSPAASSDLKAFDVMIKYGNSKLHHPEQFIKLVRDDQPGKVVTIRVARQGKILDIPVTIGSQKTPNPKEFNGLVIKKIGENQYRATIRFIGPNGNKQIRSYEGDRQQIFDDVMQAQDLPPAEREQLLFATRPRNKQSNNGFGKFFPFGGNNTGSKWMNPGKFFNW